MIQNKHPNIPLSKDDKIMNVNTNRGVYPAPYFPLNNPPQTFDSFMNESQLHQYSNAFNVLNSSVIKQNPEGAVLNPPHFISSRNPQRNIPEALARSQASQHIQENFMPRALAQHSPQLNTRRNINQAASANLSLMQTHHQNLRPSTLPKLSPMQNPHQNFSPSDQARFSSPQPPQRNFASESHENRSFTIVAPTLSSQQAAPSLIQNPLQNLTPSAPVTFSSPQPPQRNFVSESHENRSSTMVAPTLWPQKAAPPNLLLIQNPRQNLTPSAPVNFSSPQPPQRNFVSESHENRSSTMVAPTVWPQQERILTHEENEDGVIDSQQCIRCEKNFSIKRNGLDNNNVCNYHPETYKKAKDGFFTYLCCEAQRNTKPCLTHKFHIFKNTVENGPYFDFLATQSSIRLPDVFVLDCKMIYTCKGSEVARVGFGTKWETLLDKIVKPKGTTIYDFNTHASGITEENIKTGISVEEARDIILKYLRRQDVIIGHDVESHLLDLRIQHSLVIDTALLNWESNGDTYLKPLEDDKLSLRFLIKKYLRKDIQENDNLDHNCIDDARASLQLAELYARCSM